MKQSLKYGSAVATSFVAVPAFAVDATDPGIVALITELGTVPAVLLAVFGGMALTIGTMFAISKIRQVGKA